jgi:glycerol-3-phosphate acyltransferase PlsX
MDLKTAKIGIDFMGGETPPGLLLSRFLDLIQHLQDPPHLTLFVSPDLINGIKLPPFIEAVTTSEWINLQDHPIQSVKEKKSSSMHLGISALREGRINALISIGNTGALLTLSKLSLPSIPGISRPALLALMPTRKGQVAVLDLGANVSCKPHYFVEFAKMGVAYQRIKGIKNPITAILNIGTEELKGTSEIRAAKEHLETFSHHRPDLLPLFIGNVESHNVFQGEVDVLITEGFTGNIFLKTAEATLSFLVHELRSLSHEKSAVDGLEKQFCHNAFAGALLIGLEHIVIKCHSYSDAPSLINAILEASFLVREDFVHKMSSEIEAK